MISRFFLVLLSALALCTSSAQALIAVKLPVSQIYDGARTVIVGNVTEVNAQTGGVKASATALRGTAPGTGVRFKIQNLPDVLANLKEGSPFVLLTGVNPQAFALHLGDTWLLPQATDNPQVFMVESAIDLKQSYPGTTAALMKIVQARAADKYDMLDQVSDQQAKAMFRGGIKDLGKFDAPEVSAFYTVKAVRGNRKALIAITRDGLKLYSATATGIAPGRSPASTIPTADLIAVSIVDLTGSGSSAILALKKSGELLIYDTLSSAAPTKTVQLWKDNSSASAAAFGNFGEDDKPCAIVVKDENIYRYPLDGSAEPSDFLRLTGERTSSYHKDNPKWLAGATAAALDVNGDGRTDILINTPSGPMLLINRGYGAFFIDADIGKVLKTSASQSLLVDKSIWTAIDLDADGLDDLLVIADGGAVSAIMNAKPGKKE